MSGLEWGFNEIMPLESISHSIEAQQTAITYLTSNRYPLTIAKWKGSYFECLHRTQWWNILLGKYVCENVISKTGKHPPFPREARCPAINSWVLSLGPKWLKANTEEGCESALGIFKTTQEYPWLREPPKTSQMGSMDVNLPAFGAGAGEATLGTPVRRRIAQPVWALTWLTHVRVSAVMFPSGGCQPTPSQPHPAKQATAPPPFSF